MSFFSGWIELLNPDSYAVKADSQSLIKLLSPKGLLFSALLAQVPDLGFFYEIPAANFPEVTKRIIESGQLELLPGSVYEGRLVKSADGHFLRLSKTCEIMTALSCFRYGRILLVLLLVLSFVF